MSASNGTQCRIGCIDVQLINGSSTLPDPCVTCMKFTRIVKDQSPQQALRVRNVQVASIGKGRVDFDYTPTANMACHATGEAYCGGRRLLISS
jgi:hypothetical protein